MAKPKFILSIFFALSCIFGYSQYSLPKLESYTEFNKFAGPPLTDKYGKVKSVKLVYDIKEGKMYYFNSKLFKYHLDFCNSEINPISDGVHFNRLNYGMDPDRDYLLANLNYYQSSNRYVLELSSFDLMSLDNVVKLF